MKSTKRQIKKAKLQEAGITLVALVVTIIVLLILAGVTISLALGDNGIIGKAQEASNMYANATKDEKNALNELTSEIERLSRRGEDGEGSAGLSAEQIAAINANKSLQEISYKPAVTSTEVVIPSDKNGGVADQTFTQANLGTQSLKWYVLSADENGVNLVSQPTSSDKKIQFKDAGGYDNCLYYLNEISTNLFTNESGFGVDSSRVHALNLSDIKNAAEKMNGSSYDFDTTFLGGASKSSEVTNLGDSKTYGSETNSRKYPQIYGSGTGAITANNPMYDEEIPANYEPKADLIADSSLASTLTINLTSCWYSDNSTCKTNLGEFGSSGIGGELFNSSGTYFWLASRCVYAYSDYPIFELRRVYSGCFDNCGLCKSSGGTNSPSGACRVVVSIPGSRVNVSNDGLVTLK